MPLILHIDTATDNATISIARDNDLINFLTNTNKKDHASFLQLAIKTLLNQNQITIDQLDAVAVTAGPGSYTGLRVGMASAKGICYALRIPLITLSTLEVMALSVIENTPDAAAYLYCPMIDAGRMEVFTALFDADLNIVMFPCALVLEPQSFDTYLMNKPIVYSGSGAQKFIKMLDRPAILSGTTWNSARALSQLSAVSFEKGIFADLVNAEPAYLKQFYTTANLK